MTKIFPNPDLPETGDLKPWILKDLSSESPALKINSKTKPISSKNSKNYSSPKLSDYNTNHKTHLTFKKPLKRLRPR